ncbi:MAG: O-antigen ligase family protein [Patescibacteria group bacterium]
MTPLLIFIALALIFFTVLAFARLDLALLLTIIALPAYLIRFKIYGLPLTLLEAMILISFGVWFIKSFLPHLKTIIKNHRARMPYTFSIEIILLLIIAFVSAGVSGFNNGALGIFKAYFFEPVLLFILILNVFKTRRDCLKILGALLISAALISLFAIYQKITGQFIANSFWADEATRRVVSFFGYPNAVGLYLAPLIMIFIGWLFYLPKRTLLSSAFKKIIIILTVIISFLAIYFAHSRGALIGLAVALLVFTLLAERKRRKGILIVLGIVVVLFLAVPTSRNYLNDKLQFKDLSSEIRRQQWKETLAMLNDGRIISGAGLDNYQTAVKPYHQEGLFFNSDNLPNFSEQLRASSTLRAKYWQPVEIYMYPHNIFLNFWSELGLFGLLLFIWIIIKFLFVALKLIIIYSRENKKERYLIIGLLSAMIVILIHGLVDVPYFKNDLAAMFFILLALLGSFNLQEKYKEIEIDK